MMNKTIKKWNNLYVVSVKKPSLISVSLPTMKKVIMKRKDTVVGNVAKHVNMQYVLRNIK